MLWSIKLAETGEERGEEWGYKASPHALGSKKMN